MIRFGVLGTARVATYGLLGPAGETEGVEVSAIASRDPGKAEAYAVANRIPRAFGSYAALVEAPEIDAVYVALPTALHHEWAQRAIEAGKHVLCEKPLAATGDQAQALLEAAGRRGVVLAEGMHVRHHAGLKRLREMTREGAVGRTLRIELVLPDALRSDRQGRLPPECEPRRRRRARSRMLCGQLPARRCGRGAGDPLGGPQTHPASGGPVDAGGAPVSVRAPEGRLSSVCAASIPPATA